MDEIITFGGAIKALGNGKIGGYLVRYTSPDDPDLDGDFFTKDTDYDIEDGDRVTLYYNHGLDPVLKKRKLGRGTVRQDDVGVWAEAQLQMRDEYERAIYSMVEEGKLGWSSGTLPTLVERESTEKGASWIKAWPIGKDASLTPTPAAGPILTRVQPLKTWAEATSHLETAFPQAARKTAEESVTVDGAAGQTINVTVNLDSETIKMSEEKQEKNAPDIVVKGDSEREMAMKQMREMLTEWRAQEIDPALQATGKAVESMSETLDTLLKRMEDEPAFRRGGYYTEDGGTADPEVKSLGDFLLAVKRKDHKRLTQIYKSQKTLVEDTGDAGGYLVPTEYSAQWLRISEQTSPIVSRVTTVPVSGRSGEYPVLDIFTTPTAGGGGTAMAGGMTFASVAEAGTVSETEPAFEMLNWRLYKRGGIVPVSSELNADSPTAIEPLLRALATVAIRNQIERDILRGTGAGQPLGILNADARVEVSAATSSVFNFTDVGNMYSRFKSMLGDPVWIMHPGVWPDILNITVSTGVAAYQANPQSPAGNGLLGYPIIQSEHSPQDDNTGDVILADLGSYLLFQKQQLEVAYSEHAYFTTDRVGWRFTQRVDGMPWLKSTITLADPQGSYTVSPFVVHND